MDSNENTSSSDVSKHQWTSAEDAKLIEYLLDITFSGKCKEDTGSFKPEYLQQLEKMMNEKLPGCRIRAQPHIDSRVKLWKKQYYAISKMLGPNASGFSWNDMDNCITAEKDVFDEWVKVA